jgi:uncharacterized protein YbaA (DUF1428 family)
MTRMRVVIVAILMLSGTAPAARDRVNANVMKDPRIARSMKEPMPFDVKRMACGGFRVLVDMW